MNKLLKQIYHTIVEFYPYIFAKKCFYYLNLFLFEISLRGLGFFNWKSMKISGEHNFLQKYLKTQEKPLIIDIGANRGDYTTECIKANPNADIYAFEPHPENYKELSSLLKKTSVKLINKALGETEGQFKLYDYINDEGGVHASVHKEIIEDHHEQTAVAYDIEMTTLDKFVKESEITCINLLKIDAEGHESEILKGAKDLIKQNKIDVVQFEFNELQIVKKHFVIDFMNLLQGYDFYRLLPDSQLKIDPKSPFLYEIFAFQNLIAVKKGIKLS